ncbi:MAG: glycine cleavage system aminomethyltransferase GcvT [Pseudomonadota bacterium]
MTKESGDSAMEPAALRRTALYETHMSRGARMTAFAGYEMPLHYKAGVMAEHLATRESAGLFDVGHMGQIRLAAKTGGRAAAAAALERLAPMDFQALAPGRQRYGLFTSESGGILDDFMAAAFEDHLVLVVNAARKAADLAHLRAALSESCLIEPLEDRALIALQGPGAEAALAAAAPDAAEALAAMRFMDARRLILRGSDAIVTRSGYTGEDGFEISVPNETAAALVEALLSDDRVSAAGLGARDSLRLEAGLCLYGVDLDETTSPVEAGLTWAIQKTRRPGGARAGGYPGAARLEAEFAVGPPRRRVGLRPEGRAPIRAGAPLFRAQDDETPAGSVSSGVFGPSLGAPCAFGMLAPDLSAPETLVFAELRGKRLPVRVAATPFVPARYKR